MAIRDADATRGDHALRPVDIGVSDSREQGEGQKHAHTAGA
jgi:hypothetical protein